MAFDPTLPGRGIQDCDSRYHILRNNVNTKFWEPVLPSMCALRAVTRRLESGESGWGNHVFRVQRPLVKGEHHPPRDLPSTQLVHDQVHIS
jgi:hypothetical protein